MPRAIDCDAVSRLRVRHHSDHEGCPILFTRRLATGVVAVMVDATDNKTRRAECIGRDYRHPARCASGPLKTWVNAGMARVCEQECFSTDLIDADPVLSAS
jgi:hypothetical protein